MKHAIFFESRSSSFTIRAAFLVFLIFALNAPAQGEENVLEGSIPSKSAGQGDELDITDAISKLDQALKNSSLDPSRIKNFPHLQGFKAPSFEHVRRVNVPEIVSTSKTAHEALDRVLEAYNVIAEVPSDTKPSPLSKSGPVSDTYGLKILSDENTEVLTVTLPTVVVDEVREQVARLDNKVREGPGGGVVVLKLPPAVDGNPTDIIRQIPVDPTARTTLLLRGESGALKEYALQLRVAQAKIKDQRGPDTNVLRTYRFRHAWVGRTVLSVDRGNKAAVNQVGENTSGGSGNVVLPGVGEQFRSIAENALRLIPLPPPAPAVGTGLAKQAPSPPSPTQRAAAISESLKNAAYLANLANGAGDSLLGRQRPDPVVQAIAAEGIRYSLASSPEAAAIARNALTSQTLAAPPQVQRILPESESRFQLDSVINADSGAKTVCYEYQCAPPTVGVRTAAQQTVSDGQLDETAVLGTAIILDPRRNVIIVSAAMRHLHFFDALHQSLDRPERLVAVHADIVDIDVGATFDWQTEWTFAGAQPLGNKHLGGIGGYFPVPRSESDNPPSLWNSPGSNGTTLSADFANSGGFSATAMINGSRGRLLAGIRALESSGRAKLISRPSVLATNHRQALLFDNDTSYFGASGDRDAQFYAINTPLSLSLTPHIIDSEDGHEASIRLEVRITDDSVTVDGDANIQTAVSNSATTPKAVQQQNVSTIETQAVVRNGRSLIIGGRYHEKRQQQRNGVPFLSKIPLLGAAFRDVNNDSRSLQRFFILTPQIYTPPQAPTSSFKAPPAAPSK